MTLKAVVIDGNAISRNLLTTILVNGGYDVLGGSNTSSAGLAGMIKLRPQVICIDVGALDDEAMGKLDMLRTELPKAMMFMISAKFAADAVQAALQHGVRGFIVKPFNASTVLMTIRNTIIKVAKQHTQGADPAADKNLPRIS